MLVSGSGSGVGVPARDGSSPAARTEGMVAMRLVEVGGEQQFFEGEPDLEAPEELAVGEIDDEAILEEELDNEDVAEEDVDDELLAWTLEDRVHLDDGEDDDRHGGRPTAEAAADDEEDLDDDFVGSLEVEDLEDLEESLDRLLELRFAADGDRHLGPGHEPDDGDGAGLPMSLGVGGNGSTVACSPDEFVCPACFLVRHRSQRADGHAPVCRDCAG